MAPFKAGLHNIYSWPSSAEDMSCSREALCKQSLIDEMEVTRAQKPRWTFVRVSCAIGVGCLMALTIMAIIRLEIPHICYCRANNLIHSPANSAIQYHTLTFANDLNGTSPFTGEPRDELHKAWANLLRNGNTRVSADDLAKINRNSIPLNDEEGGYLVTLDVYHELHCLNILREQIYREHYPDKHNHKTQFQHVDHCIDLIRQVLMCHGDVALSTYDWIDDYRWPWPNFTVQHECRRWDILDGWAEKHAVTNLYGPILTHPVLGVSYRGDE